MQRHFTVLLPVRLASIRLYVANQVNPPAWVVAKIYCFYTEVKVYIQYSIHLVIFWLGWGWGVGG